MKIVIAVDSFKGSLSSTEAASAITEGFLKVDPTVSVKSYSLADGGEGTVETVISAMGGKWRALSVNGPLRDEVVSKYGEVSANKSAVMEMASASGITLIPEARRNPLHTTTYGVGEMINDAIDRGARSFVIGIGGSATNDGGIGMLSALGFEFLDGEGNPVPDGALGLKALREIRTERRRPELDECRFLIACDVKNPLCGESGCSHVFGPQKGATPEMVLDMDAWMKNYALLTATVIPNADMNYPGCGAAGGLGFAFLNYLGAELKSGVDIVLDAINIEADLSDCDLVITGEGRIDGQSYMGKAPVGIAKLAKKYGKPVVAFCGCATKDASVCNDHGIDAIFPILKAPCTTEEAMQIPTSYRNLKETATQVLRLIKSFSA